MFPHLYRIVWVCLSATSQFIASDRVSGSNVQLCIMHTALLLLRINRVLWFSWIWAISNYVSFYQPIVWDSTTVTAVISYIHSNENISAFGENDCTHENDFKFILEPSLLIDRSCRQKNKAEMGYHIWEAENGKQVPESAFQPWKVNSPKRYMIFATCWISTKALPRAGFLFSATHI